MRINDKIERHLRVVFKDNNRGVDDNKAVLNSKRWEVLMNKKQSFIKGGYSIEV